MKLAEFFQDTDGALSSTRLLFLAWGFGTLGAWFFTSVTSGSLQPLDWSIVGILSSLMAGKVTQAFSEKPKP